MQTSQRIMNPTTLAFTYFIADTAKSWELSEADLVRLLLIDSPTIIVSNISPEVYSLGRSIMNGFMRDLTKKVKVTR